MNKVFFVFLLFIFSCELFQNSTTKNEDNTDLSSTSCRFVDQNSLSTSKILNVPYVSRDSLYGVYSSFVMIAFYYDIENVEIGDRNKLNEKELEKIAIKNNLNISFISCGFLNLLDVIDRLNMPVVVKLNSEFIVVKGYDLEKKELYILDANDAGATFVDFESFNKAWSSQGNLMIVIRSAS